MFTALGTPVPLLSYDLVNPSGFLLEHRPEATVNEDRLKDIALQHSSIYVPVRSDKGIAEAIASGAMPANDTMDSAFAPEIEDVTATYARYFQVRQDRVANLMQPLPAHLNPSCRRSVYQGLEYGAGSGLSGFPDIDLWVTSINSAILTKNEANYSAYDRPREEAGQRTRMLAAWLWVHSGICTVTSSPLLFDTMREFITLNLSLNQEMLKSEKPLLDQARKWVDAFLNPDPAAPAAARIEPDSITRVAPNVSSLSWDEIFWLREHDGFSDYLAELDSIRSAPTPEAAQAAISRIDRALDSLVCQLRPSPAKTLWSGILGEVVGRFIPFWGVADTVRQAVEDRKVRRDYAATFWLADARNKVAEAKTKTASDGESGT